MSESTQKRTMTIKAGMTRCKTIQGQLQHIIDKVQEYAVINDKQKHLLGDTKLPNTPDGLSKNHEQARKEMASLVQKFSDLTLEYTKIKCAIDVANSNTTIVVAGRVMTLREALMLKDNKKNGRGDSIIKFYQSMLTAYANSIRKAQQDVKSYNNDYRTVNDESAKALLLADVTSMIDTKVIESFNQFIIDFSNEVDGALDTANISTLIEID